MVGERHRDDIRSSEYRLIGIVGSAAGVAGIGEDFQLGIDQVHDPVGWNARSCVDAAFEPVSGQCRVRNFHHQRDIVARGSRWRCPPAVFLPYKRVELSVNRHRDAGLVETWTIGKQVAEQRGKALLGRADVRANAGRIPPLDVVPSPILPQNPNHADIVGYPPRKDEPLSLAAKRAAAIEGRWRSAPSTDCGEDTMT